MIYQTPNDTLIGGRLKPLNIDTAIQEMLIEYDNLSTNYINANTANIKLIFITGKTNSEKQIPLFNHPYLFTDMKNVTYLLTDVRPYVNIDKLDDNLYEAAKNKMQLDYVITRTLLTTMWIEESPESLNRIKLSSARVFAGWISSLTSNVLSLNISDKLDLNIITLYFYLSLFNNNMDDSEIARIMHSILQISNAKAMYIKGIVDQINTNPENINDYISNVKTVIQTPNIKNFNMDILLNMITKTWYGPQANVTLPIAIEHPPTWMAILYSVLMDRTYKRSMIYNIAENTLRKKNLDEYVSSVKMLTEQYVK